MIYIHIQCYTEQCDSITKVPLVADPLRYVCKPKSFMEQLKSWFKVELWRVTSLQMWRKWVIPAATPGDWHDQGAFRVVKWCIFLKAPGERRLMIMIQLLLHTPRTSIHGCRQDKLPRDHKKEQMIAAMGLGVSVRGKPTQVYLLFLGRESHTASKFSMVLSQTKSFNMLQYHERDKPQMICWSNGVVLRFVLCGVVNNTDGFDEWLKWLTLGSDDLRLTTFSWHLCIFCLKTTGVFSSHWASLPEMPELEVPEIPEAGFFPNA